MSKSSRSEQEFLRVRAIARQILIEQGAALTAGTESVSTTDEADDAIGALVKRYNAKVERETERILKLIADADVARQMSDQHGAIMLAYSNAGYFFGLCTGLELASMVLGQALVPPMRTGKDGAR
jgi:hypothetical protein